MDKCAFTIVAKNYVGLAIILESSIRKYYKDLDFYIIVADEPSVDLRKEFPENVLVGKEVLGIDVNTWDNMSFKYDITEFCTSIKPQSILYMLSLGYEKVIYLDPDIYFFSSIEFIFSELNNCSIILTPHITSIPGMKNMDYPEKGLKANGIYNLGFCAVRNTYKTEMVLKWWYNRLINQCFADVRKSQFTDQKWIDFLPTFLYDGELKIMNHLGMNVAPWNFFERKVLVDNNKWYVKSRIGDSPTFPLVFVHYSGYDYKSLSNGIIARKNPIKMELHSDLEKLVFSYSESLIDNIGIFNKYIEEKYTYNYFNNGDVITDYHRRLYCALIERGENIFHPFDSGDRLYRLLRSKKMIIAGNQNCGKITKDNLPNISGKLKIINCISRFVYRLIGAHRYFLLVRLFNSYSVYETHIHLLNSKYDRNNIFKF